MGLDFLEKEFFILGQSKNPRGWGIWDPQESQVKIWKKFTGIGIFWGWGFFRGMGYLYCIIKLSFTYFFSVKLEPEEVIGSKCENFYCFMTFLLHYC